jgi:hypothetical protein
MSTFDHRGRPVGGNHRPTPRIAQALANKMNRAMFQGLSQSVGLGTVANLATNIPRIDAEAAQNAIDGYRESKAYGGGEPMKSAINDAVKNRNITDQHGMNYLFDNAPTMSSPEQEYPEYLHENGAYSRRMYGPNS